MSEWPDDAARARHAALAGRLAEAGVARVLLSAGGVSREFRSRVTDLPGEIARAVAAHGSCEVITGTLRARVDRERVEWTAPRT